MFIRCTDHITFYYCCSNHTIVCSVDINMDRHRYNSKMRCISSGPITNLTALSV